MDTVYPAAASALARGRRLRRAGESRTRYRTQPVTFAEIKEVDEENEDSCACDEKKRKPDVLEDSLNLQFLEFRRRRSRKNVLLEKPDPDELAGPSRADSDPSTLNQHTNCKAKLTENKCTDKCPDNKDKLPDFKDNCQTSGHYSESRIRLGYRNKSVDYMDNNDT